MRTGDDYDGVIFVELIKEALSLIRDQEKQIDELMEDVARLSCLSMEIEEETVRKMQERLKAEAGYFCRAVLVDDIDRIAKEMLEVNDDRN